MTDALRPSLKDLWPGLGPWEEASTRVLCPTPTPTWWPGQAAQGVKLRRKWAPVDTPDWGVGIPELDLPCGIKSKDVSRNARMPTTDKKIPPQVTQHCQFWGTVPMEEGPYEQ